MHEQSLPVLTIGHSDLTTDNFVSLLKQFDVTLIADVRSIPYSKFAPHFDKEWIQRDLVRNGIRYKFLGDKLGGRPADRSCYENGRVDYGRLAATVMFQEGIAEVRREAREQRIAIMCTEKDPINCHRGILIAPHLVEYKLEVVHIISDKEGKNWESHDDAMSRLLALYRLPPMDLFGSTEEPIKRAIAKQADKIAYRSDEFVVESASGSP